MPRLHTLTRALAAAMAVVAVAAPVSFARPIDTPKAPSARVQDLRHLKAGAPLADPGRVYWSYDYEAGVPEARAVDVDDGTPWLTIFGVAGACLVAGAGAAVLALRSRRARIPA